MRFGLGQSKSGPLKAMPSVMSPTTQKEGGENQRYSKPELGDKAESDWDDAEPIESERHVNHQDKLPTPVHNVNNALQIPPPLEPSSAFTMTMHNDLSRKVDANASDHLQLPPPLEQQPRHGAVSSLAFGTAYDAEGPDSQGR